MSGRDASPAPRAATRRRFLLALGAAGALPLVRPLVAAEPPQPASTTPPPPPTPSPAPAPPPSAEDEAIVAEARDLVSALARRFPGRFDDAEVHTLRSETEGVVRDGRALRKFSLANADEPAVVFRALPPEA